MWLRGNAIERASTALSSLPSVSTLDSTSFDSAVAGTGIVDWSVVRVAMQLRTLEELWIGMEGWNTQISSTIRRDVDFSQGALFAREQDSFDIISAANCCHHYSLPAFLNFRIRRRFNIALTNCERVFSSGITICFALQFKL